MWQCTKFYPPGAFDLSVFPAFPDHLPHSPATKFPGIIFPATVSGIKKQVSS